MPLNRSVSRKFWWIFPTSGARTALGETGGAPSIAGDRTLASSACGCRCACWLASVPSPIGYGSLLVGAGQASFDRLGADRVAGPREVTGRRLVEWQADANLQSVADDEREEPARAGGRAEASAAQVHPPHRQPCVAAAAPALDERELADERAGRVDGDREHVRSRRRQPQARPDGDGDDPAASPAGQLRAVG